MARLYRKNEEMNKKEDLPSKALTAIGRGKHTNYYIRSGFRGVAKVVNVNVG